MWYLYKIVCCVESVETRPPFLWVSCQSLEIALRARTFLLWYFSLCIKLGWGDDFTPIMLHYSLSHPQFITIHLYPLTFFHLFKLGRKTGQEERGRGTRTGLQLRRQLLALCAVGSSQPFWSISKYLFQMLTDTENSILFSFQIQSPSRILSFCFIFFQFYPSCPSPTPSPLKVVYL